VTQAFSFTGFDPLPLGEKGLLDGHPVDQGTLLALNIQTKYLFVDDASRTYHEYILPTNRDVHNIGGYVGKVVAYRDPRLLEFLAREGVSKKSFSTPQFPLLATRSPQLDLVLFDLVHHLRSARPGERVTLFDLGCTVAEHWDLLDTMFRAASGGRDTSDKLLSYHGLDYSMLVLLAARLLHARAPAAHFQLIQSEGSEFTVPDKAFDLSLTVGVVNHTVNPVVALERMMRATRHAAVMALWVTLDPAGLPAIVHSGAPFYFFSHADLLRLESIHPDGRFLIAGFIPEEASTQQKSYIGLGEEQMRRLGCYHLVYTTLKDWPMGDTMKRIEPNDGGRAS
jgi:hypothetical protein